MGRSRRVEHVPSAADQLSARAAGWVLDQFLQLEELRTEAHGLLSALRELGDEAGTSSTVALADQLDSVWVEMRRVEARLGLGRVLQRRLQPQEAAALDTWLPADTVSELDVLAALHDPG